MSHPKRHSLKQTGPLDGRRLPPRETNLSPRISFIHESSRAPSHLLAQIGNSDGSVTTLGFAVKQQIMIGREDPSIQYVPDLNLTEYGAQDAGVSRQHAFIVLKGDQLFVRDNSSKNNTFLNEQKMEPDQLYPLQDGDMLTLGRLPIVFYFVYD